MRDAAFIVIGAGIAGASAGYWLAETGPVVLLEREDQPGYHATGRSAALFSETYGSRPVRALTVASRPFYEVPPPGFADSPLLTPRGVLFVGRADQEAALARLQAEGSALVGNLRRLDAAEIRRRVPVLRDGYAAGGVFEPDARDIDVHALHQGFLRGLRARGGRVVTGADVRGLRRANGSWEIRTSAGDFRAPVVVNAAGAWADSVGELAGAAPIGLMPKRRTAITFDPPPETAIASWPMLVDADEQFYFKPDAGRILASPADETPMPPCDAQPDDYDIAVLIDRLEQATTLTVKRIAAKWAGLRSFVADKSLVIGFDPVQPGFFWLAGQGGYGVQTAPAAGRAAAALAQGASLPADLRDFGLTAADLSPARPGLRRAA